MQRKLIAILVANLFLGAAAYAQDFALTGAVGVGGLWVDDRATDASKLNEYRDMGNGVLSVFEIKGQSSRFWVDGYAENLGRDDQYARVRGGAYNQYRFDLFSDSLRHNFGFGMRTPYNNPGAPQQTATLPALNPATWNVYDLTYKRRSDGGGVEVSFGTPFYLRADLNEVKFDGNKLQAYAQGTSPGNGYVDLAIPFNTTTRNLSFEGGYATKTMSLSLAYLSSKFDNDDPVLRWTNGFFGGLDASPLAPNNKYERWAANGVFRKLPLGSTLALRYTTSESKSDNELLGNMLSAGGTRPASNPTSAIFNGKVKYDTYSLALNSNPTRAIDTRVYYNHYEKENESRKVDFIGLPSGFGCGDNPRGTGASAVSDCVTELFSYKRVNYGIEGGMRLGAGQKVTLGYDFSDIERERLDITETKDRRYTIEYRNSMFDMVTARLKYEYGERRSNFLLGNAGANPQDAPYLQRFVRRYDSSNRDSSTLKLAVDVAPLPLLDLGAELLWKRNDYKDTLLGRTSDDRDELYLSVGYGDKDVFRVLAFFDYERVRYDSYHRSISNLTATGAYDPGAAATSQNYNWGAVNVDKNRSAGLGFDLPLSERFKVSGSTIWARSTGAVDVMVQSLASGAPAATLLPIGNYGNNEKFMLNVKGTMRVTPAVELSAGAGYEDVKFDDVQFNGYTYIVPAAGSGTQTSYLSGWYAKPAYRASILWAMVKYRF